MSDTKIYRIRTTYIHNGNFYSQYHSSRKCSFWENLSTVKSIVTSLKKHNIKHISSYHKHNSQIPDHILTKTYEIIEFDVSENCKFDYMSSSTENKVKEAVSGGVNPMYFESIKK